MLEQPVSPKEVLLNFLGARKFKKVLLSFFDAKKFNFLKYNNFFQGGFFNFFELGFRVAQVAP